MQEIIVGTLVTGAFAALARMSLARAGIGRARPDCGCGSCGGRRGRAG